MRAAVIEAMQAAPRVGDAAEPAAGPGEVVVDVTHATLNPVEVHIWRGTYRDGPPQTPYVPGLEGVGTLDGRRVRFEVVGLHPGYGHDGALAERAVAPAGAVTPLPDDVDDATAAAAGATGITALRTLECAGLRPDETVLVLGATGLVGRSAVQLARALGAGRIIAAGRDAGALDRAVELGADAAVRLDGRPRDELAAAFREAAPAGIDVVVDPLWGEPALAALGAAAVGVRHVNIGRAAGDPVALPHALLLRTRATLRGLSTAMDPVDTRAAAFARVLEHVRSGALVVDHEVLALGDVAVAWDRQTTSPGRKLVLRV